MKKDSLIIYIVLIALSLHSCYSDDSERASVEIGDISISGIAEKYTAIADNEEVLTITPTIKSVYAKQDLEYHWYIYDKSKESSFMDDEGKYYEATLIGEEEILNYPVDLTVGEYTIMLRVNAKSNNITAYERTSLHISTRYTEGFYILKESDGNTELDFLAPSDEKTENLFTRLHGAPVAGKPGNLSVVYNHAYIDEDTHKPTYNHTLCVVTDANKIRFLRATDLAIVHDEKSLFYAPDGIEEVPYTSVNTTFKSIYLSSKGAYITNCGGGSGKPEPIGKFGNPEEPTGASPFVLKTGAYETVYWNEKTHGIYRVDMNGGVGTVSPANNIEVDNLTDYKCISAGYTYINYATKLYFLFEETSTGNKIFYRMKGDWSGIRPENKITLNSNLHFTKATYRSYNGRWASLAYCVDNGKLYAYELEAENGDQESEINPEGIPVGEEITYVENIYWAQNNQQYGTDFSYLVVGTQKDNTYTLYMYNMLGGRPNGMPIRTVSGTGKLKRAVFLAFSYPPENAGLFMGYPY